MNLSKPCWPSHSPCIVWYYRKRDIKEPVLLEADDEKVQSAAPDSKYNEQKGDGIEKQ